jgi:hypothetical protein
MVNTMSRIVALLIMSLMLGCGALTSGVELETPRASRKTPEAEAQPEESAPAITQSPPAQEHEEGVLSREEIRQVIRASHTSFQTCFEKALRDAPNLRGRVVIRFRILGDGSVLQEQRGDEGQPTPSTESNEAWAGPPTILSSELSYAEAESCMLRVVSGLQFPEPREGGELLISYPFFFMAEEPPRSKLTTFGSTMASRWPCSPTGRVHTSRSR